MAREMKDSGIEWIGEIPEGWKIIQVKRLFKIGRGRVIAKTELSDKGYPVYSSQTKNNGILGYIDTYDFDRSQLTWTTDGANAGTVFLREGKHNCTNVCGTLMPYTIENNLKYLKYILEYIAIFHKRADINGYKIMNNEMANIHIVLPERYMQDRIASYLDNQCNYLNNILEKTRASIEEYKKLKQAVITQAVTKGIRGNKEMKDSGIEWIGEIPAEWKTIRIKWMLNERKEKSENGEEEPLSMSQKYGIVPTKEMEIVPNMASSFIGAKIVYSGDLVFNKLKAHLGVFAVSEYDGLVSPDYAVYYSQGIIDVKYLEYLFKTPEYIAEFKKRSSGVGAGLTRLYTDELYDIYCLLPPQDEQIEITGYLNKKIGEIDVLIKKKEQYLSEIENYKKSLIYEYVTGKKEVPQE